MRVLITGSRTWTDRKAVYRALNDLCEEFDLNQIPDVYGNTLPNSRLITVVHGGCPRGADSIADDWCISNNLTPEVHPADWKKHGKAAGFVRNSEMVALGADICLAFIRNQSAGSSHTARQAELHGIEVRYFTR